MKNVIGVMIFYYIGLLCCDFGMWTEDKKNWGKGMCCFSFIFLPIMTAIITVFVILSIIDFVASL